MLDELQRLLQRHHLGVMAGEGGLEFGDHARPQLGAVGRADLLQERKQQPAADAPGHAERPVQLGRTDIEAAIDVDLLVHARSVAAVDFCGLVDRDLHAGEDLAGELAAADGVERDGRAGFHQRVGQIVHEGRGAGIDDMFGADLAQDVGLLLAAHDVDEADAVLDADLVEHLAEVGGGGGMHQRLVAFAPHGFGHAERGQRIDEAGRAFGRRGAVRQRQDILGPHGAVLRIHRAADHRHGLAHQRLGGIGRSGLDHDAGALVADRHRFIEPCPPSPASPRPALLP